MNDNTMEILNDFIQLYNDYKNYIKKYIVGLEDIIEKMFIALFSNGNCLIESYPGLAKTTLVKTFASFFNLKFSRIQFTPDLMPLDIIGSNIIQEDEKGKKYFEFYKGPIFSNIILGDEINRATPKTQSAFLEAMEEKKITFLGNTYPLEYPFLVFATQNPIELSGTYPLPEAQIDRFMFKLNIDYPDYKTLYNIINLKEKQINLNFHKNILNKNPDSNNISNNISNNNSNNNSNNKIIKKEFYNLISKVVVADNIKKYITSIVLNTNPESSSSSLVKKYILYPASVRTGIFLIIGSKWKALLDGRLNVSIEDVDSLVYSILIHRIVLNFEGEAENLNKKGIIEDIIFKSKRELEF